MAQDSPKSKKPRIRKTAPTIRQRVEAAQAESIEPKASKLKTVKARGRAAASPIRNNPVGRLLPKIFRPIGKVLSWLVPRYFINSWREVRQVTWPSRRETWRLTLAVFIFAIIFGAAVAGVDVGIDKLFKKLVLK
jgi:preprotein translocase SecE subunit